MGKYLDIVRRIDAEQPGYDKNDINDRTPTGARAHAKYHNRESGFGRIGRFGRTSSELERRCPDHVDIGAWQQAVDDARAFLARWGEQAEALGWTTADLFGLAPVPDIPMPKYRRLSRYDLTGLVWLLRGRSVIALTEVTAAIQSSTGAITIYRRHDKPAFGPLGDSLEDLR